MRERDELKAALENDDEPINPPPPRPHGTINVRLIAKGRAKPPAGEATEEEGEMVKATLAEIREQTERAMQGECGHPDEVHCSCRPILLRAIEGLKAKIAELKGMTAYARTSEATKQSVEYWCERATLAEEVGKITQADLAAAREQAEKALAAYRESK